MVISVTNAAENYLFTELSTETGERETDIKMKERNRLIDAK